MTQANYKYPFDKTGKSLNNLVKEPREITKKLRTIVPVEGPYFTKSLIVKLNGKVLTKNKDYKCVYLYQEPTALTGKEVCGAIKFVNSKLNGPIFIEYQVVGGYYTGQRDSIEKLLNEVNGDDRLVDWESILNIPEAFMPAKHLHHRNDLIGYITMINHLAEIRDAIENLRSRRNVELYRLIGNTYSQVQNFIDKNKGIYDGLTDRVSLLESKVGNSALVSQDDFDDFKVWCINRQNALDAKIIEADTRLSEKVLKHQKEIESIKTLNKKQESRIGKLEDRFTNLNIELAFIGAESDAFMSISRAGDVFTLSYELPSVLSNALTELSTIRNKMAQLSPLSDQMKRLTSRVTENERDIATLQNDVAGLQTTSNEHTRLINDNYNNLAERINNEALTRQQDDIAINARIDELSRNADTATNAAKSEANTALNKLKTELKTLIDKNKAEIDKEKTRSKDQDRETNDRIEEVNNAVPATAQSLIDQHYTNTVIPDRTTAINEAKAELISKNINPVKKKVEDHDKLHKSELYRAYEYFSQSNMGLLPLTNPSQEWWKPASTTANLSKLPALTGTEEIELPDTTTSLALTGKNKEVELGRIHWIRNNWLHVSVDVKLSGQEANAILYMECLDVSGNPITLGSVYTEVRGEENLSQDKRAESLIQLDELKWSTYTTKDTDDDGWVRLSAKVAPGWQRVSGDAKPTTAPYAGTHTLRFVLKTNTLETAQTNSRVYFINATINPAEKPIEVSDIKGFRDWLESWFAIKIRENQNAPTASRWDLSRFRVQPGAESFSTVNIDENDNIVTKGIVYYDSLGAGERALFSPTTTFNVTESTTWVVPSALAGRMALVIVRADSLQERTKVMHSAVRQMFVKLETGTSIPITVGQISSFGRFLTVSNAVDYKDAVYPRIESVKTAELQRGMVTIHV